MTKKMSIFSAFKVKGLFSFSCKTFLSTDFNTLPLVCHQIVLQSLEIKEGLKFTGAGKSQEDFTQRIF